MKMYPVVHFEMPRDDARRVADFYAKVFGWKNKIFGPEMSNYITADTTESDKNGPLKTGAINGGFFPRDAVNGAMYPSVVIAVDDIKSHIKLINESGGKVLGEPVDIPGVGLFVSFTDTEGNRVSILEAHRM
jgi:predicted enzyme related to lactoylglutathione lyase